MKAEVQSTNICSTVTHLGIRASELTPPHPSCPTTHREHHTTKPRRLYLAGLSWHPWQLISIGLFVTSDSSSSFHPSNSSNSSSKHPYSKVTL